MKHRHLRKQARLPVGSKHQRIYSCDRQNADHDRGAPRHAEFKHLLRVVELLCRNKCHRVAGQHCRIGPISVQETRHKDANAKPHCKRREDQISRLREEAGDSD